MTFGSENQTLLSYIWLLEIYLQQGVQFKQDMLNTRLIVTKLCVDIRSKRLYQHTLEALNKYGQLEKKNVCGYCLIIYLFTRILVYRDRMH